MAPRIFFIWYFNFNSFLWIWNHWHPCPQIFDIYYLSYRHCVFGWRFAFMCLGILSSHPSFNSYFCKLLRISIQIFIAHFKIDPLKLKKFPLLPDSDAEPLKHRIKTLINDPAWKKIMLAIKTCPHLNWECSTRPAKKGTIAGSPPFPLP